MCSLQRKKSTGDQQWIKLFPVELNAKWGYIDKTGNAALKLQSNEPEDFSKEFAL